MRKTQEDSRKLKKNRNETRKKTLEFQENSGVGKKILEFFQVYRDAADGSDTFSGEVRLLGIKLFFTTDAANDA